MASSINYNESRLDLIDIKIPYAALGMTVLNKRGFLNSSTGTRSDRNGKVDEK
jgi:hypothetical protein